MNDFHSQMVAFRIIGTLLISTALGIVAFLFGNTPTREASRLGLRGLKRQRELKQNENWATIEPFVRWLGVRISRFVPKDWQSSLDRQLALSGDFMGITPDEFVALSFLCALGGVMLGAAASSVGNFKPALGCIIGIILCGSIPYSRMTSEAELRLKSIARGLPYVTDLMALSMGAGLDFPGAIRQVVEKSSNPADPIIEEFSLILQTLNLGRTRKETLIEFGRRAPIDSVAEFVNAIVQAEERGNPLAEVLSIQAVVARNRRSVRAEELATKAAAKLLMPLILVFFVVLGLVLIPSFMTMKTML